MPGRGENGEYGEVTSTSDCTDYQARRLNVRYKPAEGKGTRFVHTLNGTAVALSRALIVVIENYQRADGLIIASPTGSTAYSLSAGGPLMHPAIDGWVIVPIAPHTLSNRPIVLAEQSEVVVEVVGGRDASANFDMQSLASLLHGDRVVVRRAAHHVRFLHPLGWSYFDTLRKKLHWNEGAS